MVRVPIVGAPYSGKSIIASGQECVNLYAEINANNDPQAPVPVSYYPTPGTKLFANPQFIKNARGAYRTSIGTAYYVVGQNVYFLTNNNQLVLVGVIADRESQIKFSDNGLVCILVDGVNGYVIDLFTNQFGIIIDPNFYGADYIALLDTFFIFNRPETNQFYISASNASYGMLTNSAVAAGTITNAGSGGVDGVYQNVPLTGGTGSGAVASSVQVTGGVVTGVDIGDGGINYLVGDVLTAAPANIGGVAGFTYTVNTSASAFDPLDIAAKSGFNDPIVGIVTVHRELWLIGALTTEIWIGTGAADFYFQEVQGSYVNHGCIAQYSIATQDVLVFFLMQDQQGKNIVVQGMGYDVTEISTPRIVSEFNKYSTTADAIGFCFQIEDHSYYAIVFPTANKGWIYDLTIKWWYEWNWTDIDGNLNRPRANCCMFANNANLIGDWENGLLLQLDINTFTDYTPDMPTGPITRIRTFPHSVNNNLKVSYKSFDADIEVGTANKDETEVQVFLSWSDDKGRTYGNPVGQSLGLIGEFRTVPSWNRLGEARDRIFKLQWSTANEVALNGAFVETTSARS